MSPDTAFASRLAPTGDQSYTNADPTDPCGSELARERPAHPTSCRRRPLSRASPLPHGSCVTDFSPADHRTLLPMNRGQSMSVHELKRPPIADAAEWQVEVPQLGAVAPLGAGQPVANGLAPQTPRPVVCLALDRCLARCRAPGRWLAPARFYRRLAAGPERRVRAEPVAAGPGRPARRRASADACPTTSTPSPAQSPVAQSARPTPLSRAGKPGNCGSTMASRCWTSTNCSARQTPRNA